MESNVLIVDDNVDQASLAKHILRREGFTCIVAQDVGMAWKSLVAHRPDFLLLDINLPDGDGWSLLERIRGDQRTFALPVVIMTASLDSGGTQLAHALGAEFLEKSMLTSQLKDRMHGAIARALEMKPPTAAAPGVDQKRVHLILGGGDRLTGVVHVPGDLNRFSDSFDSIMRDARVYIPVTEARLLSGSDDLEGEPLGFVLVRKTDIRIVIPQG